MAVVLHAYRLCGINVIYWNIGGKWFVKAKVLFGMQSVSTHAWSAPGVHMQVNKLSRTNHNPQHALLSRFFDAQRSWSRFTNYFPSVICIKVTPNLELERSVSFAQDILWDINRTSRCDHVKQIKPIDFIQSVAILESEQGLGEWSLKLCMARSVLQISNKYTMWTVGAPYHTSCFNWFPKWPQF